MQFKVNALDANEKRRHWISVGETWTTLGQIQILHPNGKIIGGIWMDAVQKQWNSNAKMVSTVSSLSLQYVFKEEIWVDYHLNFLPIAQGLVKKRHIAGK